MRQNASVARILQYLCAAGVALCLAFAITEIVGNHPSKSWPQTPGTVVDVSFVGLKSSGIKSRTGSGFLRRYRVRYQYEVDGKVYSGVDVVSAQPERKIPVRYQPGSPEVSGLTTGVDLVSVVALCGSALLLWVTSVGCCAVARKRAA